MIEIKFNRYLPAPQRKTVRAAAEFFMQELLPTRKANNTDLVIRLIQLPRGISGFCSIHDLEDNDYNPKMFSIDLNGNMKLNDVLETLAHEMVHMRQFRNKELGYRNNYTRFRGRVYSLDMDYDKEPWEKEAYKLESILVKKFVAFYQQGE